MNTNRYGLLETTVGHAHLLDDIINLVRSRIYAVRTSLTLSQLEINENFEVFERLTLTYGLSAQHELYKVLKGAQSLGVQK